MSRATETTAGRLGLLLGVVALVVLLSAALAQFAFDLYADFGEALWSATLHLLDPSSLQDDEGAAARTIGIFQVIAGLVLLVGLLFTFVAETVGRSLERLGQSDRPVRCRGHLLIVGGSDLIPVAARAAAEAIALRPAFGRIVVLAPEGAASAAASCAPSSRRAAGRTSRSSWSSATRRARAASSSPAPRAPPRCC